MKKLYDNDATIINIVTNHLLEETHECGETEEGLVVAHRRAH
jgi:hypothetical protein